MRMRRSIYKIIMLIGSMAILLSNLNCVLSDSASSGPQFKLRAETRQAFTHGVLAEISQQYGAQIALQHPNPLKLFTTLRIITLSFILFR